MAIKFYACGDGVFVGNAGACDEHAKAPHFDHVIHIAKPSDLHSGLACEHLANRRSGGLTVIWAEGDDVSKLVPSLDEIAVYAARGETVLIHSVTGHCRAPHLAVAAKVARGCDPYQAVGDVVAAVHKGCGLAPTLLWPPLTGLLYWAIHFKEAPQCL